MPTLVWKRRPKNGAAAAREAAVPDPVVSAAAAAVPESVVSFPAAFPDRVASSGCPPLARSSKSHADTSKKERKVNRDSLTTAAGAVVSDEQGGLIRAAVDHDAKPGMSGVDYKARSERDLPTGVTELSSGKFQSRTRWGGKNRHIGCFDTHEQASGAYISMKKYQGYLDGVDLLAIDADGIKDIFDAAKKKALEAVGVVVPKKGLPTGVKKSYGKYKSQIRWGGKLHYIGTFDTSDQASTAYISVKKDLEDTDLSALGADGVEAMFGKAQKKAVEAVGGVIPKKMKPRSERGLPTGVFNVPSGKFRSSIRWGNKTRCMGTFDTPKQASAAFMSVKADVKDAKKLAFGADKVDDIFDAAKKKALETARAMKESDQYGDEHLV